MYETKDEVSCMVSTEDLRATHRVLLHILGSEDPTFRHKESNSINLRCIKKLLHQLYRAKLKKRLGGVDLEDFINSKIQEQLNKTRSQVDGVNRRRCLLWSHREAKRQKLISESRDSFPNCENLLTLDGPANHTQDLNQVTSESKCEDSILLKSRPCYICKVRFNKLHTFYDQLCPTCADLNWIKRTQTADLRNKIALVTGGRIKIGFEISLKLLRAGATVVVTTRFPKDAESRFQSELDCKEWKDRLIIYGSDFRDINGVEKLCLHLENTLPHLDILINNAAQTIRRPMNHSNALDLKFGNIHPHLPCDRANTPSIEGSPSSHTPPPSDVAQSSNQNLLDVHGQIVDTRQTNSWKLKLDQVPTLELAEVMAINSIVPFILCSKLKPLMLKGSLPGFIINVSSMEGKFNRFKHPTHPHTNMAKAALNMLTRTSASDYAENEIYMNSVDTGWVTNENPLEIAVKHMQEGFHPPLDEIDGAARVLDPIFMSMNGGPKVYGKFLKDYKESEW